jgi:hypothetical protein
MRYTEQELRDFLTQQADGFATDMAESEEAGMEYDYAYAQGAYMAYQFVLRFMNEYKAEEK